jgi:hypothetical protein
LLLSSFANCFLTTYNKIVGPTNPEAGSRYEIEKIFFAKREKNMMGHKKIVALPKVLW